MGSGGKTPSSKLGDPHVLSPPSLSLPPWEERSWQWDQEWGPGVGASHFPAVGQEALGDVLGLYFGFLFTEPV